MSDIFYTYGGSAYANLTNKCPCRCTFCIRNNGDSVGSAQNLWLTEDPSMEDILDELGKFGLENYSELVFCGYGEPSCALDNLVSTAKYVKEHYNIKTRINTNGLGNLINGKDIIPIIAPYTDSISISLNAPDAKKYNNLCHPAFDNAYNAMLKFAEECKKHINEVTLSVVDVISEDDIEACRSIAENMSINFRVRIAE